jgi:hypothetical protein
MWTVLRFRFPRNLLGENREAAEFSSRDGHPEDWTLTHVLKSLGTAMAEVMAGKRPPEAGDDGARRPVISSLGQSQCGRPLGLSSASAGGPLVR